MADPQRMLSNLSDADDVERELLGSIQRLDPPDGARSEAWARLSVQIAAVALVSTAHGSAAAAAKIAGAPGAAGVSGAAQGLARLAAKLFGSKAVVALVVACTAVGTFASWLHFQGAEPPGVVAAKLQSVSAAPVSPLALAIAQRAPFVPASEPRPTAIVVPDSSVRPNNEKYPQDRLSAESALLAQARAELRNGDTSAAARSLNRLRTGFPKGVLGQEREVLAIEVLAAQGNTDAARRRAKSFISAYPKSPHSAQLGRFSDAP